MKIIDVQEAQGRVHDFEIYKQTIGSGVHDHIKIEADLGYLGIRKLHANSQIPKKSSKHHQLDSKEKAFNRRLSRKRVVIEHVNAKIKTFKIMTYPYRNHRQRHLLRMSLICGIINFEMQLS